MPPNILELRPDRKLLNPEFEGYKLSLEAIPTYQKELSCSVDSALPNNEQHSILHAKIFGLHNHLVGQITNDTEYVYYADKMNAINKVYYDPLTSDLIIIRNLWTVPTNEERSPGDFNVSFKFASNNLVVLSDGSGLLYVLEIDSRQEEETWNNVFCDDVLDKKVPFIIEDCRCLVNENKIVLHCLLLSVSRDEVTEKFISILNWVSLSKGNDNKWGQIAIRELTAIGSIYYSQFETTCEALYVVSDSSLKFTLDSENPIIEEPMVSPKKIYMWTQTKEDVTIKLKLPNNFENSQLIVSTTSSSFNVKYQDDVILAGEFYEVIDNDLTTWTVQNHLLEIVLYKCETNIWPEVIKGNDNGEYYVDQALADEIHEKLAHLCSDSEALTQEVAYVNTQELEECDYLEDKSSAFERISVNTHETTHKIHLSSHKMCLTVKSDANLVSAIAFAHDVDACVWQPEINNGTFNMQHIGTLLAFSYVQASKEQKKFTVCSPDLTYSVICETNRHIFIYRQNKPILDSELRNRTTSKKIATIAQQQVISLDNSEVLGVYAGNSMLFILNQNYIFALKI